MIKPNQIIAARGLLRWSRENLAEASEVHSETIKKIETGSTDNPRAHTLGQLIEAFNRNGVEFIDGGVREKKDIVRFLEGDEGIKAFYDDVATTAEQQGGEFLVYGVDETYFVEALKRTGAHTTYRARLQNAKPTQFKVLIRQSDPNKYAAPHCTYRRLPDHLMETNSPFYVYGSKLAHIIWSSKPQIIRGYSI